MDFRHLRNKAPSGIVETPGVNVASIMGPHRKTENSQTAGSAYCPGQQLTLVGFFSSQSSCVFLLSIAFSTDLVFHTERKSSYDSILFTLTFAFLSTYFRYSRTQDMPVSPIFVRHGYSMFLLDIALLLYQLTVFPVLGIKRVPRKQDIRIDRRRPYLPWVLKLGCAYCGYAHGLLHYAVRIAGDTELYFCPSKLGNPGISCSSPSQTFCGVWREGFSRRFHGQHDTV